MIAYKNRLFSVILSGHVHNAGLEEANLEWLGREHRILELARLTELCSQTKVHKNSGHTASSSHAMSDTKPRQTCKMIPGTFRLVIR